MTTFTISSTVRTYPRLPYEQMKDDILGSKYQLSLVFVGADRARTLNETHRGKSYVPNVLSFPLDEACGEIFICPTAATQEAKKYDMTLRGYIGFLFIHGLLHLKGHAHSDAMDAAEQRYVKKYALH